MLGKIFDCVKLMAFTFAAGFGAVLLALGYLLFIVSDNWADRLKWLGITILMTAMTAIEVLALKEAIEDVEHDFFD